MVPPPGKALQAPEGKSDQIDFLAAAQSVLPLRASLPRSAAGIRASLARLLAARRRLDGYQRLQTNALIALVRITDLGIDARRVLTDRQITLVASWRTRPSGDLVTSIARADAVYLAMSIRGLRPSCRTMPHT